METNLDRLSEKFTLEEDPRYAGGSMWRCNVCGQLAHSEETWFPCHEKFVPTRIRCNECRNRWALEFILTPEDLAGRLPT